MIAADAVSAGPAAVAPPPPLEPDPPRGWRRLPLTPAEASRSPSGYDLVAVLLLAGGTVLWLWSTRTVRLQDMTDLGLASVLPATVWLAYAVICAAFLVALVSARSLLLATCLLVTVVVMHGLSAVTEPVLPFHVAWRHLGIVDYIQTRTVLDPTLDVYQSWPGFFALGAFLSDVLGLQAPAQVVAWAPVVFNVLYLLPLIAMGNRLWPDPRTPWIAAWLFTLGNWIGQDYYSPQGLAFFLHLTVVAIVLEWFKNPTGLAERQPLGLTRWLRATLARFTVPSVPAEPAIVDAAATPVQRRVLIGVIALLMAAIIGSHQLTPFMLIAGLTTLIVAGWCRLRWLPVLALLGTLLWFDFPAAVYIDGHGESLQEQIGAFRSILRQTVGQRLMGTPEHLVIVRLRLVEMAGLWLLALVGLVLLVRCGYPKRALGIGSIAAAPFLTLAVQSYGGEAGMRVSLFALPFVAMLAAAALTGLGRWSMTRQLPIVALVGVVLVGLFPLTRYGNERADWYSSHELQMVQVMYQLAPPGSVLTSVNVNLPSRYTGYADYEYRYLAQGQTVAADPDAVKAGASVDMGDPDLQDVAAQVAARMRPSVGQRSFLEVSRSQGAALDQQSPFPAGALDRLTAALRVSPSFRLLAANPDAQLYELVNGGDVP